MNCRRCETRLPPGKYRCLSCHSWNTAPWPTGKDWRAQLTRLSDASIQEIARIPTGPFDRCLGGGLVRTSVVLLGGAPGAGKSTMALHIGNTIAGAEVGHDILYVAAEESIPEIRNRAMRLGLPHFDQFQMTSGDSLLGDIVEGLLPSVVIVDSLPGMFGDDHAAAVLACKAFKRLAEKHNCPIVIIDHVTKADDFAGLMSLQHEVSALITLFPYKDPFYILPSGERVEVEKGTRILKTVKNRFGPSHVETLFTMTETGLKELVL